MSKHNDLLGRYHLYFLDNVVRTRESTKNTYVYDKIYEVHVYPICWYLGEKIFVLFDHNAIIHSISSVRAVSSLLNSFGLS